MINGFKCHRDKEDQTESNEKESGEAARHEARGKKRVLNDYMRGYDHQRRQWQ